MVDDAVGDVTLAYKVLGGDEQLMTITVPEPATMTLLAIGGLGALIRRKRR